MLFASPGCPLAVLQCHTEATPSQIREFHLIYYQLTQTFSYWFRCWGKKTHHILLYKHSGKHLSSPFLRLNLSQTPLLPPSSSQLPLFSPLVPTFPPSQSLRWGDGQHRRLESSHGGFCLLPLVYFFFSSTVPGFSLLLCPSVDHAWPVKKRLQLVVYFLSLHRHLWCKHTRKVRWMYFIT